MSSFFHRFRRTARESSKDIVFFAFDVAKYLALFHVTATNVVNFTFCVGPSMNPTINEEGECVLIDLFSYKILDKEYEVGDVIISVCPTDRHKTVCKRVKAVAGDTVVNYKRHMTHYPEVITIPEGHVWLAGDNPSNSTDSRSYGPVSVGLLQGRVFTKVSQIFSGIPDLPMTDKKMSISGAVDARRKLRPVDGSPAKPQSIEPCMSPYEKVMLKRVHYDKDKNRSNSNIINTDKIEDPKSTGNKEKENEEGKEEEKEKENDILEKLNDSAEKRS